jgi:short-subunit dehydrogenase
MSSSLPKDVALITGATASIGAIYADRLTWRGYTGQTVSPEATVSEFWDVAGCAPQKTSEIPMQTDDPVDAALAGLDAGERVTIPGLHEAEAWTRWEQDRREMSQKFRNPKPAPRYQIA